MIDHLKTLLTRSTLTMAVGVALLGAGGQVGAQTISGDPSAGQQPYAQWCAACHGGDPAAGVKRVQLSTSQIMVQSAIARIPDMQPLAINLSAVQTADIAAFVSQRMTASTAAAAAAVPSTGEALYTQWCAACHGGDPASGVKRVQLSTSQTMIQVAIANIPDMQPLALNLSSSQMADIATYVAQRLQHAAGTNGATAGGTGSTVGGGGTSGGSSGTIGAAAGSGGSALPGALPYAQACAVCHGTSPATGTMRVQLGTSLGVLQNAITAFPAMRGVTLNATQLTDVAAFIAADVSSGGSASSGQVVLSPEQRGDAAYAAMCASCHGKNPATGVEGIRKATTVASIQTAIARKSVMRYLSTTVTDAIAADVAAYVVASRNGSYMSTRSASTQSSSDSQLSESTRAGGCTIGGAGDAADPLWLVMLAGAGLALRRRISR